MKYNDKILINLKEEGAATFERFSSQNNNTFNFEKLIDFEDAPAAITTYKNKIYVASHQNFYEVENFQKKKIFGNEFWTSLYPNSIAIFNEENVFIGMRSGFARINLKNKKINFYRETNNP